MIEFKQIIGRGTRLFEGKSFFTIIDFEDAYQLFYDYDYIEDERKLSNDTKKYKFKKMKMIDSI